MKEYKLKVLNELNKAAIGERIISVREKAAEVGIKHLKTQEVLEICNKFIEEHNDYKLVKMMDHPYDSLFCSATLIEKCVEFIDEDYDIIDEV